MFHVASQRPVFRPALYQERPMLWKGNSCPLVSHHKHLSQKMCLKYFCVLGEKDLCLTFLRLPWMPLLSTEPNTG